MRRALPMLSAAAGCLVPPPVVRPFTLITFDVDGTLVKGSGKQAEASAHARAFAAAVGSVYGSGAPTALPAELLPRDKYHGSTDGLIALNMARAAFGTPPEVAAERLDEVWLSMYEYVARLPDAEVAKGIEPLPGVLDTLRALAADDMRERVACGLVTGNVEGIARKKMRSVGVHATGALAPPAAEQRWAGEEDAAFLGGFGSDFCSGQIDDGARNHLDRAEQIVIAARRCRASALAPPGGGGGGGGAAAGGGDAAAGARALTRVVHVGDAPADVLAARACAERGLLGDGVCVGMVGVATGSYSSAQLAELAGPAVEGKWEPVILEEGIADPGFLAACGVV
eukprot:Transcript_11066.p1 GENE.Transcript_11066~~Transcript_11066.p1  ORF type:complete len:399 (+),score=127.75 Transcript_11066:176-1198(+)